MTKVTALLAVRSTSRSAIARFAPSPNSHLVVDVLNGGADVRQQPGEVGNAPRAVAHGGDKPYEAGVGRETAVDDAAEGGGVDVAAAYGDDDGLALVLGAVEGAAGEDGRKADGAAALSDQLRRSERGVRILTCWKAFFSALTFSFSMRRRHAMATSFSSARKV